MLDPIYEAIGWLLSAFYSVVPNLGIAIILLTFTIMLILYPLTAKQAKSMIAMQRLQPEIKRLQAKYKNDRQKLNEEVMKVYQENKVNPLAGCLPLLVQLPIFFSLFHVLRDSYKYVPLNSNLFADLCRHDGVVAKTVDACVKGNLDVNHLKFLSMDLQKAATDVSGGVFTALPYFILVLLVMVTGFMQTRQAQRRTPQTNKQMAMVMKVLPVFFGVISLQFPAGLVLYFFVSNLWRLGQQEVIFRRHGTAALPAGGKGAIDVASKERPAKAPPREELEEAPGEAPAEAPTERPAPRTAPDRPAAAPKAVPTARRSGGGLRGLFQVPPPEANGGTATGAAPPAVRKAATGGAPPKPPPPRKRRNKKKRKR
ncbi:MAG TPA: membrane protein insertase YidC [Actinomycetota bacterium]|nr:membrane protein insertase YidC [Actinomycetota bacterium]